MFKDLLIAWFTSGYSTLTACLAPFMVASIIVIIHLYVRKKNDSEKYVWLIFPLDGARTFLPILFFLLPLLLVPITIIIQIRIDRNLIRQQVLDNRSLVLNAIIQYQENNGHYPETLDDLLRNELDSIPYAVYERPFEYRPRPNGFVLSYDPPGLTPGNCRITESLGVWLC